tara:strand:+ start:255 stop:443 length:189 start_codon:yes stop_codon:yes gene_type:complete
VQQVDLEVVEQGQGLQVEQELQDKEIMVEMEFIQHLVMERVVEVEQELLVVMVVLVQQVMVE